MFETHGIIASLIIGLIIGAIAKALVGGKEPSGCLITILIGLVGSYVGGVVGQLIFGPQYVAHWIASILGAMLVLYIYHGVIRRS
jgi:uncharacterized membrane protein YeaQ/YmgE (transglycosylase-associated protein family)